MKVSVLVPVYGVEKYIERCAVSLFEQTHRDMEYVFVNDCTPDSSISILRSVIERYPDRAPQVRIIDNEVNRGVGATRAVAIAAATGECIMHADSDDYMPPRAVELLCAEMERSGADVVDGAWQRFTSAGLSEPVLPCQSCDNRRYLSLMLCQNIVSNRMWGRLFRRSLYADHGITLVPGVDYSEDYSIMTRLMFYAKRSFINDVVYYYSDENTASYTHTRSERHLRSYLKANRIVLDFFTENDSRRVYAVPLQLGMINALRCVRTDGYSFDEAYGLLPYRPSGPLFKMLAAMFRGRCPFSIANFAYLTARKICSRFF